VEIDGELWFSAVDFANAAKGGSDAPRQYWYKTKQRIEDEDGETLESSTLSLQLKIEASDGKKYLTDMLNEQGCYRVLMAIPGKQAARVRKWMIQQLQEYRQLKANPEKMVSAGKKRLKQLAAGHESPDRWLNRRLTGIELRNYLTTYIIERLPGNKRAIGRATNITYTNLFGMDAGQLKACLKSDNPRDAMHWLALEYLSIAEGLSGITIRDSEVYTEREVLALVEVVTRVIGGQVMQVENMLNVDVLTGQPLLPSSEF
jgi:prophage antirepressor-like protein